MPLKLMNQSKKSNPEANNHLLEKARDQFIENAGKISANMLGMVSKVGGQIYALLFLSRKSLSLDEITDILKLSKGNVSVNVRLLESVGLIKKAWVKGTRRDYYEAQRDYPRKLLRNFFDRVRGGIDDSLRMVNRFKVEFEGAAESCQGERLEDVRFNLNQLYLLEAFYQAASQIFDDFYQGRSVDTDLLRRVILE